jgi:hypothetical protein
LLAAHATEKPEPIANRRPGISPRLAALVMALLEKRPEDRPQSAESVLRTLDHVGSAHTGAIPAAPPVQSVPSNRSAAPRAWHLWVIVVVTLAILVLVIVALKYFVSPSRRAADPRPDVPAPVAALASTDLVSAGRLDRAQKVHTDLPLSVTGADPGIMG